MTKKQILKASGLTEAEFYKRFPTQGHWDDYVKKYDFGGTITKQFNQQGDLGNWGAIAKMNDTRPKEEHGMGFQKFVRSTADLGHDALISGADIGLSAVGVGDIIGDSAYKTNIGRQYSNIMGGIAKTALPIVASAFLGPAGGAAVGMAGDIVPNVSENKATEGGSFGSSVEVEGAGKSQGYAASMKKGELLTLNGKILKSYVASDSHSKQEKTGDHNGIVTEKEGTMVIPKNMTKEYLGRSKSDRKLMELSLNSRQEDRERKEMTNHINLLTGAKFGKGGEININPKNRGKFTEAASKVGMSVQEYASHILTNKDSNNSTLIQRTNFAKNASKFKHQFGGAIPKAEKGYGFNILSRIGNNGVGDGTSNTYTNMLSRIGNNGVGNDLNTSSYTSNSGTDNKNTNPNWLQKNDSTISQVGALATPLYNLGRGLFGKTETTDPNAYAIKNLKPEKVTDEASVRAIRESQAVGNYANRQSGRYDLASAINLNIGAGKQIADARERVNYQNATLRSETNRANADIDMKNAAMRYQVDTDNMQVKTKKTDYLNKSMEQLGSYFGQRDTNAQTFKYLSKIYPSLSKGKKGGRIKKGGKI